MGLHIPFRARWAVRLPGEALPSRQGARDSQPVCVTYDHYRQIYAVKYIIRYIEYPCSLCAPQDYMEHALSLSIISNPTFH